MDEFTVDVEGTAPAKNEARSMLAAGHPHEADVRRLLSAVRSAMPSGLPAAPFGSDPITLHVRVFSPFKPRTDATNILGGIADVLESKGHRGHLEHLGDLADVAVYENDRQIEEVTYAWTPSDDEPTRYEVTIRRRAFPEGRDELPSS